MEIIIENIDNIAEAAKTFVSNIGDKRIYAFYGKMGAGKTTFTKAVCEQLGVEDVITSPTFAIVNEYEIGEENARRNADLFGYVSPCIYHFDFYRIKRLDEFFDMGGEDYFNSGSLCFIEWPELIEDVLPLDTVKVTIEEIDGGRRVVRF